MIKNAKVGQHVQILTGGVITMGDEENPTARYDGTTQGIKTGVVSKVSRIYRNIYVYVALDAPNFGKICFTPKQLRKLIF